jgi:hypothetical protein
MTAAEARLLTSLTDLAGVIISSQYGKKMDSVPGQLMFSFDRLRSTVDDPQAPWQLLLRVVADFSVLFDGKEFYRETEFPIVEFASQAAEWLRDVESDLLYVSMESEEQPLLGFYWQGDDRFRLYSPHQMFEATKPTNQEELRRALSVVLEELGQASEG